MGTLLAAAEQLEAAEPCYLNAQTLAPDDARWPYYLGQLYRIKGPVDERGLIIRTGPAAAAGRCADAGVAG